MSGASKSRKPVSYYIEWGYVKGRGFTLNFLAFGSMLFFYRIGSQLGAMTFGHGSPLIFWVRLLCVILAYYSIDWVLKVVLTDASTVAKQNAELFDVNGNKIEVSERNAASIWKVAIAALCITTGISVASNFFVSSELSGDSHLLTYQSQLVSRMNTDSALINKALQILDQSADKQTQLTANATAQRSALIDAAIKNGSPSWRNDYYLHKNNSKAWFWTCKSCPSGYIAYREGIKVAIAEGDKILARASGYSELMAATLSPTLSPSMAKDSTLMELKTITQTLESERKHKERLTNIALLIITIASAIVTFLLTWLLRKHRIVNGQLVNDNPARFMMVTFDIFNRVKRLLSDILFTVTFNIHELLLEKGWLKSYTVEDTHVTESLHATVRVHKTCIHCDAKLIGKRSDSKYCNDTCRANFHAEKRKKKIA